MIFTNMETSVLNRIQADFPIAADPFSEMARELSLAEDDFLRTARDLRLQGIIRNISGIFNTGSLGYASCLVAIRVEEGNIDRAARAVNGHPGVSHNYLRDHRYNLWFTLATESEERLEQAVKILAAQAGIDDYLLLRNEKMLKIGLLLDIGETPHRHGATSATVNQAATTLPGPLTDEEKESIRLLQIDLPVEKNPFAALIDSARCYQKVETLIHNMERLKRGSILRRYSAVLRHREAGFLANAMTVWKPGAHADIDSIAGIFKRIRTVSHLYIRTTYPGKWEYPLFAMVHAHTEDELTAIIAGLAGESGIDDYQVLRTVKEFKKERVVYFSPRFGEWERQAGL